MFEALVMDDDYEEFLTLHADRTIAQRNQHCLQKARTKRAFFAKTQPSTEAHRGAIWP